MTHLDREIDTVINGETTSHWLKTSLKTALLRDPLDAAQDSAVLANLLEQTC
tara:strand:+ start:1823 stop:1978 length:156 start_codon:yes stop_codon:yes gene_type:complete